MVYKPMIFIYLYTYIYIYIVVLSAGDCNWMGEHPKGTLPTLSRLVADLQGSWDLDSTAGALMLGED